jgi:hypothetical protein
MKEVEKTENSSTGVLPRFLARVLALYIERWSHNAPHDHDPGLVPQRHQIGPTGEAGGSKAVAEQSRANRLVCVMWRIANTEQFSIGPLSHDGRRSRWIAHGIWNSDNE